MPIAIVTGGNSGIGKAISVTLAKRGYDVGLTWHSDGENTEEVLEEIRAAGARGEARQMDVDVPVSELEQATVGPLNELIDALGGIDVFVSNAGMGVDAPTVETSFEDWMRVQNVVLNASFLGMRLAAQRIIDAGNGGRIVAITSVHEHQPLENSSPYVAAKHGLGGLVKNLAIEVAEHGITVNAVAPGEIATKMTGQEDQDPADSERPGIPLKRPGHAYEVAWMVGALCEPDARYATGQSFVVDGGMLQMGPMANQLAGP